MKINPLAAFLMGALFLSSVSAAGFAIWHVISVRAVYKMQPQLAEINVVVARTQMLINEAMEYRKHNPAIDPILQTVNPRASLPASAPTKSPGK